MKCHVHDTVRRLMGLASLEEQLSGLKHDGEKTTSVTALIESLRANIPVGVLINHDQMRKQGRRSVAEVREGVCAGCHIALAIGNVAAVRRGDLHRCGNCGRYLYMMEADRRAEAAASSASARSVQSPATAKPVSSRRRS